MTARIYRPSKTAMQSGRAGTRRWLLEFERSEPRTIDPLMGWTGSGDTEADQVRLSFPTREDAVEFAKRHGIDYRVDDRHERRIRPKSYAANFRWQLPE